MVGLGRFELPTSRLSGVRSNQLSYRPEEGEEVFVFWIAADRTAGPPAAPPLSRRRVGRPGDHRVIARLQSDATASAAREGRSVASP